MRKFCLKLMLFSLVLVLLDVASGYLFGYMQNHPKGGDTSTSRNNYICNRTREDVLVLGSSRALHHYDPKIITDSLGLSCYNCGEERHGILLSYGRLKMINRRYHPRIVIFDVFETFDLLQESDNHVYLKWLRPFYGIDKSVDSIFWKVDYKEKYKMYSNLYRYNSQFIQLFSDYLRPHQSLGFNGFRPVYKQMEYEPDSIDRTTDFKYDSLKWQYLEKFIQLASENSIVVFVVSPTYKAKKTDVFDPLKRMCKQHDVLFLDYYCDPDISTKKDYFYSSFHLNNVGADVFTKKVISKIKNIYIGASKGVTTLARKETDVIPLRDDIRKRKNQTDDIASSDVIRNKVL